MCVIFLVESQINPLYLRIFTEEFWFHLKNVVVMREAEYRRKIMHNWCFTHVNAGLMLLMCDFCAEEMCITLPLFDHCKIKWIASDGEKK